MTLQEQIDELKECAESNMNDGDTNAICDDLIRALDMVDTLAWMLEDRHCYLDEVEGGCS